VVDSPKITLAPRDQRVIDGGVVSFFCKSSGNPAPDVYWRKAGRRITTGRQRYVVVDMPHGSVLRVEPVKSRRDDSVVECVADNGIGEPSVASAKLHVYAEEQCTSYSILSFRVHVKLLYRILRNAVTTVNPFTPTVAIWAQL